jgi:hypothetical protein
MLSGGGWGRGQHFTTSPQYENEWQYIPLASLKGPKPEQEQEERIGTQRSKYVSQNPVIAGDVP